MHLHPSFIASISAIAIVLVTKAVPVKSCTNVLVTPGASMDGNPMIAYNADSGGLQGMLYHYPPTSNDATTATTATTTTANMRKVYSWDTGVYLGEIPESPITYNVVGNTNEYGLVIAETTFGGVEILSGSGAGSGTKHGKKQIHTQQNAKIDYGSLIYITLQRCKNATEAIHTMTSLMDTYGYASEGESFSIADSNGHVWIMEVISRGSDKIGSVWVAMKIPDGMISAHSNQARITTFPRDDPTNCLYADDVVSLAKEVGLYAQNDNDPDDLLFSFSDTYNPLTFLSARASEARTWSIFSMLADDNENQSFEKQYEDYAQGKNLTNRMPLYIKPKNKVSFENVMTVMSNHYENTILSSNDDIGSGPYAAPYRARPIQWNYNDKKYHNERSVATQQTGWNFIAQIRLNKPYPLSSVLWFAVDDSSTSPRFPVYGCSRDVSSAYSGKGTQDGVVSPLLDFNMEKSFWIQNMVSNFVYSRWEDAYPFLQTKLATIHEYFKKEVNIMDEELLLVLDNNNNNPDDNKASWAIEAIDDATSFSVKAGDWLHKEWTAFYGELFAKYRDYFIIEKDENDLVCNCNAKEVGFSDRFKAKIVEDTGDHYECLDDVIPGPDLLLEVTDNEVLKKEEVAEDGVEENTKLRGRGGGPSMMTSVLMALN
jgi:dipeptidase